MVADHEGGKNIRSAVSKGQKGSPSLHERVFQQRGLREMKKGKGLRYRLKWRGSPREILAVSYDRFNLAHISSRVAEK